MYSSAYVTAKVLDIGFVTVCYFLFAVLFSIILQIITEYYDRLVPSPKKTIGQLLFEVVLNIFFVAVAFWVIRNIVERIPSPVEGVGGYNHARFFAKDTNTQIIATLTLILFQTSLMDKIKILNSKLFAIYK